MFLATQSAQAGLFEYHLGVETSTNNSHQSSDVVEQINTPSDFKYKSDNYNSNYYTDSYYSNSYNRPYEFSYYDHISHNNNYYNYSELKRFYEEELENLEWEADYIDDIKRDIKLNISDLKRYNSRYYYDIRISLNDELNHLEDREREVEDLIDEVEDEIDDLNDNRWNSNNRYYNYYNGLNYYDSWSNSRYDNRYGNYRYNRGYYRYDYDQKKYIPHWVNPDLEDIDDGHIYIR